MSTDVSLHQLLKFTSTILFCRVRWPAFSGFLPVSLLLSGTMNELQGCAHRGEVDNNTYMQRMSVRAMRASSGGITLIFPCAPLFPKMFLPIFLFPVPLTLYPLKRMPLFSKLVTKNPTCPCMIYHLKAIDQCISYDILAVLKEVMVWLEMELKSKNKNNQ